MNRSTFCTLLLLALVVAPAAATTFTVGNTNNSGAGSLRQAITDANGTGGATAGSPHIIDATGTGGTISLESALPAIGNHVAINGPGASSLTITRGVATEFRIFTVNGYTVTIDGVTITNGTADAGGGIYNSGTLTMTNSIVSGNGAGSLGGGIYSDATLTVTNSTLSGNFAGYWGGGIYSTGTLTVTNSTLTGNTTACTGGGIYNTGSAIITNATITLNDASAYCSIIVDGEYAYYGGGGIANLGGTVTLLNTILIRNTLNGYYSPGGELFSDYYGEFDSQGHNLVTSYGWGNWIASDLLNVDAMLEPLASNGGPTQTMALGCGSPAIDAGGDDVLDSPYDLTTDQRGSGYDRRVGSHVDIGAYESAGSLMITTQPADLTVIAGEDASFTAASNSPDNAIQWQRSTDGGEIWSDISGATGTTYAFTSAMAQSGDYFRAIFSNVSCSVTSQAVALAVKVTARHFTPAQMSIGVSNASDDGRRIDVRVEIYRNETLICSGEITGRRVAGSTQATCTKLSIPLAMTNGSVDFGAGDLLSTQVLVRRSDGSTSFATKLWYNDSTATGRRGDSRFDAGVEGSNAHNYYLRADGDLSRNSGTGARSSEVTAGTGYATYGTWSMTSSQMKVATGRSSEAMERGFTSDVIPNPFTASTGIRFILPVNGMVSVRIHDQLGDEVAVLLRDALEAGAHDVTWNGLRTNGERAATGDYFYRIESAGMSETGRVVLVR